MKRTTRKKTRRPRRPQNVPTVEFVSDLTEPPPAGKEFDLRDRRRLGNRVVEFPQMKGRVVQSVVFHTSTDENTISIRFRDRTLLSLHFEPALVLTADLLKVTRWDADTIKQWPPIHSEPRNPNA